MLSGTVATIPMLFLGGVVLAMRKDVVLSLVLLAFVPLLTLIVVLLGKRVLPLWGKSDDYIDVQNALLRERLRGIRVIRAFNTEKREHGRIADATHIMAENIIRANVSMGLLTPLATLFLNISALLIIYLGGWRMVHGVSGVSAGDIFAIIQYVTMVMNGVIMASFAIIMYPRAQVAAGRTIRCSARRAWAIPWPAKRLSCTARSSCRMSASPTAAPRTPSATFPCTFCRGSASPSSAAPAAARAR